MGESTSQKPARTSRRRVDPRRAATRKRILDAAIELIQEVGLNKLTSVAIAKRAGIHQPAFYAHFKGVENCLEVAATDVVGSIQVFYNSFQQELLFKGVDPREIAGSLRQMLDVVDVRADFVALFVRQRLDVSPIGKAMRGVLSAARTSLANDLMDFAANTGVKGRYLSRLNVVADLCTAVVVSGLEALSEGRITDRDALAWAMARQIWWLAHTELEALRALSQET